MKVAYVINSLEGGGASSPIPAVVGALRDAGLDIRVLALTGRDRRGLGPIERAGIEVRIREGGERDHLRALAWLSHEVSSFRAQAIWTSLTRATLLGQIVGDRQRLPVASWQHNAYLRPANRLLLQARRGRTALWVADSVRVGELTATRLGVDPARIAVWPLFQANPDAPRVSPWKPGEPVRVGSLGRLHPAKGYDVLVRALAAMQESPPPSPFEVLIAGEGDERGRLQGLANQLGVGTVLFPGFDGDPSRFLSSLHLYVQPSRREGLCIAAHEAMQAGLPVVASAVGELSSSVAAAGGPLVPPADVRALASALSAMLSEPARLVSLGASARALVLERFAAERFAATGAMLAHRLASIAAS